MFHFPKNQKLCSRKVIEQLFKKANNISEGPLQFIWNLEEKRDVQTKTMIIVPKKKVKLANKRNELKRKIKEAYRLQKHDLEFVLKQNNKQLNLAIIYQAQEIYNYNVLAKKINVLLKRLRDSL